MKLQKLLRAVAEKTGATVNLEPLHRAFFSCDDLILAPEQYTHYGTVCMRIKNSGKLPACQKHKRRSLERALQGKPFPTTCPFGVWDLAVPVLHGNELVAVLYLGHFAPARTSPLAAELPVIDPPKTRELRAFGATLAGYIDIALHDWRTREDKIADARSVEDFYVEHCRRFIEQRYADDIRLSDFARIMRMNRNYLGGMIIKGSGLRFCDHLRQKRIGEAAKLLTGRNCLSISDIAYRCGFADSNYFCTVFKRVKGVPPRQYRTACRSRH